MDSFIALGPGHLRAPLPDPLSGLQLPLGAGRDGLALHHVPGVAVELHHLGPML
jgi:hypothetical protein